MKSDKNNWRIAWNGDGRMRHSGKSLVFVQQNTTESWLHKNTYGNIQSRHLRYSSKTIKEISDLKCVILRETPKGLGRRKPFILNHFHIKQKLS